MIYFRVCGSHCTNKFAGAFTVFSLLFGPCVCVLNIGRKRIIDWGMNSP